MADVKKGGIVAAAKAQAPAQAMPLEMLIKREDVQKRFQQMLDKKAPGFLSSLLSLVSNNKMLQRIPPMALLAGAAKAAAIDMPLEPSLGKVWLVPYGDTVQFQIGYKGIIELAQRSGQMKSIVMTPVYEGEIKEWNRFTETYIPGKKQSDNVVGYFARFEMVNGFAKASYWTKDEVLAHAKRFSKAFKSGPWQSDFDAMACKTVLMSIMKTFAPTSIEMQNAFNADNVAFNAKGDEVAANNSMENVTDVTYEEVEKPQEAQADGAVPFDDAPTEAEKKQVQEEILQMMEEPGK